MIWELLHWVGAILVAIICLFIIFYTLSSIQMIAWIKVLSHLTKREKSNHAEEHIFRTSSGQREGTKE